MEGLKERYNVVVEKLKCFALQISVRWILEDTIEVEILFVLYWDFTMTSIHVNIYFHLCLESSTL